MRVVLHAFLTLDGVVQAPGGPGEDEEGGFPHGGWSFIYGDEEFGRTMANWISQAAAFLLGRKTYEIFAGYWPKIVDPKNPIATQLNKAPKYVASRTLRDLEWEGSSLLGGDLPTEVKKLKETPGGELQIHGSSGLAQTLMDHELIDEYRLLFFPIHLGMGKKLFREGTKPAALQLTSSRSTPKGVLVAVYENSGLVTYGSYADSGEISS